MGTKILVVEDDDYFRAAVVDGLRLKRFEVFEAPNGKSAKEIMSVQTNLDLVLTDIQMPGLTGLELLEWSKKHKPVPFIMMTGFSMILETQSAYDLGAKGFIAKPFKIMDLFQVIENVLGIKTDAPAPPSAVGAREYCKVSIDEFVARPRIDFDVYVQLSAEKYIKVAHKGDEIQRDKIEHYKTKGVRHLHILKEDFGKLVDFNLDVAKLVHGRDDISAEKKINFIKYTGEVILEKAFVEGVDRKSFDDAQTFLKLTVNTISESKQHMDMLSLLNSHSDYLYAHSVGVAMFCIMMARRLDFESNQVFFKLSMAGMFHDIGKKEIDREVLEKPRPLLSSSERKMIESHVPRGQEILMAIKGIPEDVLQIVMEHHEDLEGMGYPLAKVKKDQHPLSKILQVANLFVGHALKGPNHPGMNGPAAIAYIDKVYMGRVDRKCIEALKGLFP